MRNQTLSNLTEKYLRYKAKRRSSPVSKDRKLRFDLAEGLWSKSKNSQLPDRNHSELKQRLATFLGTKNENISIFAGADEIIEIIPRLYIDPEDTALVAVPVFERLITTNMKVGAKVIPFKLSQKNCFRLQDSEAEKLIEIATKNSAKLIWLCTPGNPTGQVVSLPIIKKIAERLPSSLLVINEVYQEYYSFDKKNSTVSLVNKVPNIIVIRSFSKAFGLAGVRVGYAVADFKIIAHLESFRTMYNLSTYAQEKAISVLSPKKLKETKSFLKKISEEREKLSSLIQRMSNLEVIDGSKTNFLFLRHKNKDLFSELYKKDIIVGNWGQALGVEGKGFVRISINIPKFNRRLLESMKVIN